VGQFPGPPTKFTSAGPGISQILSEELQKLGIKIETPANIGIEGKYQAVTVKETKELAVRVVISVVDAEGKSLLKEEYQIGIFGEAEVSSTLGLTTRIPPKASPKVRHQKLKEAYTHPDAYLDGTRISTDADSPYALEILVADSPKGHFSPRHAVIKNGHAFVPIHRGEIYRLRLINHTKYEAAARITIDGISMFAFTKMRNAKDKPYSNVIFDKKAVIKGWFINYKHSDSFLVTEYAKTAAAELKSSASTGTITVCFSAAWPKNKKRPADEPRKSSSKSAGDDGTGRGPRVGDKYEEVPRKVGVVRATISVRYTK
jgi:hypothetical protein